MRTKLAALLVLAITAVGIAFTGSALAVELPDISLLSGEAFPVVLKGETAKKSEQAVLETELGEKLTAEHVIIEIEWGSLSSLALFHVHFLNVEEPKSKSQCNTSGDEPGKVLISGEFHTVFLIVGPPWVIHGDILWVEITINCNKEKLKVKVRSPLLTSIKAELEQDITSLSMSASCTPKGKQEITEYTNDEGTKTKANLTANFGLGFEKACMRVAEPITLTASKMFLIKP